MAYKTGNRNEQDLFPPSIEDYISQEDPVRAYDAFVEALDLEGLGIEMDWNKVGNSSYCPKSMLKLVVYGYSYGIRSSRKLERATHHNLSFIWLTGGLKPDHKTIANFRRKHRQSLSKVLSQCARLCFKLGLIEGNCLFVDGSKIRGNCSIKESKSKEKWEAHLEQVQSRIVELLEEAETLDQTEEGSLVELSKDLASQDKLQDKIKSLLKKMNEQDLSKINGTDPESINFRGRQGSHSGYNAQVTVDEKHGLIVSTDVVNESNDLKQFTNQIQQAQNVLVKKAKSACGDAGYSSTKHLREIVEQGVEVVVPNQEQALHKPKDNPFCKAKFHYSKEADEYRCPEGHVLTYSHYSKAKRHHFYRIKNSSICQRCPHFGKCTNNKRGRIVIRLEDEDLKEDLATFYSSERGQEIYKKRKEKVEHPFGHIKRNLNAGHFLMRGLKSVRGEMALIGTCFNLARMMTLLGGTNAMIMRLKALKFS